MLLFLEVVKFSCLRTLQFFCSLRRVISREEFSYVSIFWLKTIEFKVKGSIGYSACTKCFFFKVIINLMHKGRLSGFRFNVLMKSNWFCIKYPTRLAPNQSWPLAYVFPRLASVTFKVIPQYFIAHPYCAPFSRYQRAHMSACRYST